MTESRMSNICTKWIETVPGTQKLLDYWRKTGTPVIIVSKSGDYFLIIHGATDGRVYNGSKLVPLDDLLFDDMITNYRFKAFSNNKKLYIVCCHSTMVNEKSFFIKENAMSEVVIATRTKKRTIIQWITTEKGTTVFRYGHEK